MNQVNRSLCLISIICVLTSGFINAQERPVSNERMIPELRRQALVLDITARVLESEQVVIWNETHQKITIPGTPVGIRLEGANVVVSVQFNPFIRRSGNVLLAQVQIGINDPEHGFSYHTSIQTIPFEFNEPIYFFPLGQSEKSSLIEIILTVNPYTAADTNNDN